MPPPGSLVPSVFLVHRLLLAVSAGFPVVLPWCLSWDYDGPFSLGFLLLPSWLADP